MMRVFPIVILLVSWSVVSNAQNAGWTVILSSHRMIDSLGLRQVSHDSLLAVKGAVPVVISIDELAEIRESSQTKFMSDVLVGGVFGLAASEVYFQFADTRQETRDNLLVISLGTFSHLVFVLSGTLTGMIAGGVAGLSPRGNEVYDFRKLTHEEKIDLLESLLERDDGSSSF